MLQVIRNTKLLLSTFPSSHFLANSLMPVFEFTLTLGCIPNQPDFLKKTALTCFQCPNQKLLTKRSGSINRMSSNYAGVSSVR